MPALKIIVQLPSYPAIGRLFTKFSLHLNLSLPRDPAKEKLKKFINSLVLEYIRLRFSTANNSL